MLGVFARVLHAPSEREAVLDATRRSARQIVTLTVTEKAYRPGSPRSIALLA